MPRIKIIIKCMMYYLAKFLGLFKLAMKLTEGENRILCYHGGSIHDEHVFWPGVFNSKESFIKHLKLIKKYRFKVLPLASMVQDLKQHHLPKRSLVITFDDGFYSTALFEPLLKEANYPATIYVTTYYMHHQRPIFTIALNYLFYKTKIKTFSIKINNEDRLFEVKTQVIPPIFEYADKLPEDQQNQLLREISELLKVDFDFIWNKRLFHILSQDELKVLHSNKIFDIQLHTHNHNLPDDEDKCIQAINKNRESLHQATGKNQSELCHFCYPNGTWKQSDIERLKKLDIASATTLDLGLNNYDTEPLALKRILCHDDIPLIILEAHLSGFTALVGRIFGYLKFS